ncbi:hypothetical protein PYCC9005_002379 [Savitreella phatthalungensis]
MAWFWQTTPEPGSDKQAENGSDLYRNLDPELAAFARQTTAQLPEGDDVKPALGVSGLPAADDAVLTDSNTTAAEKVVYAINARDQRKIISKGAQFNCAVLESELTECLSGGENAGWRGRLNMCEAYKRKFYDCLEANKIVLTQLGYGARGNSEKYNQQLLERADDMVLASDAESIKDNQNKA